MHSVFNVSCKQKKFTKLVKKYLRPNLKIKFRLNTPRLHFMFNLLFKKCTIYKITISFKC